MTPRKRRKETEVEETSKGKSSQFTVYADKWGGRERERERERERIEREREREERERERERKRERKLSPVVIQEGPNKEVWQLRRRSEN